MGLAGVLLVRGRPADDRAQRDERRPIGDLLCGQECVVQRADVLDIRAVVVEPVDSLHVPAVRRVAGNGVFGEGDVGVVLDRDVVVVPEQRQIAEPLGAGDARRFAAHAFFEVAVGGEAVDVVVERALAGCGVRIEEAAFAPRCHRHADGVADALAERSGGRLDTERVTVLRVSRGQAAPRAQQADVFERQAVAGQVELDVERQARVPARQYEAIASQPVWLGRVVAQQPLEQQVGRRCEAHGRAGVS